jgi:hypothetical protein
MGSHGQVLESIDEDVSDDEIKKYRRMLDSISSLSRRTFFDNDDCEIISPLSLY